MNSSGASKDARSAVEIPAWDPAVCTQCGKGVIACPHGAIRARLIDQTALGRAPVGFQSRQALSPEWRGLRYTLQISPTNCTGCGISVPMPVSPRSVAALER